VRRICDLTVRLDLQLNLQSEICNLQFQDFLPDHLFELRDQRLELIHDGADRLGPA
jgi:hypothetical protein